MNLTDVLAELRNLNEPVPKPLRLPTEAEVNDVVFGALEPAVVTPDAGYLNLVEVAESAWDDMELPRDLLPFCEDNGDYYCLAADGTVKFWSHNGTTDESWSDLATWIKEVWIEEG
jgi:hypothetical protein